MRIIVGVLHPEQNRFLAEVRKWKRASQNDCWMHVTDIQSCSLQSCLTSTAPEDLVVAIGVNRAAIDEEFLGDLRQVIVYAPSDRAIRLPTASLISSYVSSAETLTQLKSSLEKMILRSLLMRDTKFRRLETSEEFEHYLHLRYRVWREKKYYKHEGRYESDYCDRSAIHFGMYKSDELTGAARLIFPLGQESTSIKVIEEVLKTDETGYALQRFIEQPRIHPFDALEVLPQLNTVYREWVTSHTNMAELSRVVVNRNHRRHGLGAVLVDSTLDFARESGVHLVFLACRTSHEKFYRRSGFEKIPDISADQFFDVKAPVIAMSNMLRTPEISHAALQMRSSHAQDQS